MSQVSGSLSAAITQPRRKANPLTAGDWHRELLFLRHDLAVDRRAETDAVTACERRNREYIDHLFGLAEAAVETRGAGPGSSLSEFIHKQPLQRMLALGQVGDGRWVARERACEASSLVHGAELGVYSPRVVELTDRLDRLVFSTTREFLALQKTHGRRVWREERIAYAEGEQRRAKCADWKRALEKAATCGWISFVGATVVTLATTSSEIPIGAGPGGAMPGSTGVSLPGAIVVIPLAFAVASTAALLWVKRVLRRSRRDGGHAPSSREDAAS